jgi:hypothetical protein
MRPPASTSGVSCWSRCARQEVQDEDESYESCRDRSRRGRAGRPYRMGCRLPIDSPAEIAARTAPPQAAPILVPAEERVISTDIVTRVLSASGPLSSSPWYLRR